MCVSNFCLHNTHPEGTICITESKEIFCPRADCTTAIPTFRMHTVEIPLQPNGRCLFFNTQAIYKMLNLNTMASYINNTKRMLFHFCLILHNSGTARYLLQWATKSVAYLSNFCTGIYCDEIQIPLQLWSEQQRGT